VTVVSSGGSASHRRRQCVRMAVKAREPQLWWWQPTIRFPAEASICVDGTITRRRRANASGGSHGPISAATVPPSSPARMVMPTGVAVPSALRSRPVRRSRPFPRARRIARYWVAPRRWAAFWPAVPCAGDQPVVAQLLAAGQMRVIGGPGDRPDPDDARVGRHRRRVRGVADPEHSDVVVLAMRRRRRPWWVK